MSHNASTSNHGDNQSGDRASRDERERGRRFPFDTQKNHILISLYENVIVL